MRHSKYFLFLIAILLAGCYKARAKKQAAPREKARFTLTYPVANEQVISPTPISGYAVPNTPLDLELLGSSKVIERARPVTDETGKFFVMLKYRSATIVTGLRLRQAEKSISIPLRPGRARKICGRVIQASGGTSGDKVYVSLYKSKDDILEHIAQKTIRVKASQMIGEAVSFPCFRVSAAVYYLRAFRDVSSPNSDKPDGYPTLGSDPQTKAIRIDAATSDVDLKLVLVHSDLRKKYHYSRLHLTALSTDQNIAEKQKIF